MIIRWNITKILEWFLWTRHWKKWSLSVSLSLSPSFSISLNWMYLTILWVPLYRWENWGKMWNFPKSMSGNSEWMMTTWPKNLSYDSNPGRLFILSIPEMASLVTEMVKNLPAIQETWVQSLGQEDPLEKGMATHSSNLAWGMPWIEEPGGLQSMGVTKSQTQLSN